MPITGEHRRSEILREVNAAGQARTSELAEMLAVSAATIHRDLEQLARRDLVERVHGGARAIEAHARQRIVTDWSQRLGNNEAAKAAIAGAALKRIESGSTIFLDASTTCLALARAISVNPPGELTIVTSSPAIAYEFHADTVHLVIAPGDVDQNLRLIGGSWTVEFVRSLNFQTVFFSAAGITLEHGLVTTRRMIADLLVVACSVASERVALVDSSKFDVPGLLPIVDARDLDAVIVDDGIRPAVRKAHEAAGAKLSIAPMGAAPERPPTPAGSAP